jgi:hypothetical protein
MKKIINELIKIYWWDMVSIVGEIFLLSLLIYLLTLLPHDLEIIKNHSLLSWMILVSIYKLLTFKNNSEPEAEQTPEQDFNPQLPITVSRKINMNSEEDTLPNPSNIYKTLNDAEGAYGESTRE